MEITTVAAKRVCTVITLCLPTIFQKCTFFNRKFSSGILNFKSAVVLSIDSILKIIFESELFNVCNLIEIRYPVLG